MPQALMLVLRLQLVVEVSHQVPAKVSKSGYAKPLSPDTHLFQIVWSDLLYLEKLHFVNNRIPIFVLMVNNNT